MKIVTGKTGTPHVTSRQFRGMMEGIIGQDSYIITHGENLELELVTNNKLKIKSGMMCHHGNISTVEIGTYDEVTIQNGTQGMKRIDLVVNRYSKNDETGIESNDWIVIQGTPAADDPATPSYTEGNLQEGDLVDDCPVFEVHLDGINVTEVKKLLSVTPDMSTLNADLSNRLAWTMIREVSGGGFGTQSIDLSKYSELMLTVGPFAQGNTQENSRVLASTIIPVSILKNVLGKTDPEGVFQVVYSGSNSRMFGGLNYYAENTVQIRASGSGVKTTLWAR